LSRWKAARIFSAAASSTRRTGIGAGVNSSCLNQLSIVPVGTLLTTQEAADLLNVSRPYLIKLLDQSVIRFERSNEPGSHRKIRFVDLMEYKHKIDMERRKQLRKLTEMSQDAGFYEE
jgi:excisionase family DNA binding protein